MHGRSSPVRWLLLPLTTFALAACGSEESSDPSGSDLEVQAGNQILFEGGAAAPPPDLEDELARRDAAYDGWPSEILHSKGKKQLQAWMRDLLDPSIPLEELVDHYQAEEFGPSHKLVLDDLEAAYEQNGIVVRRPAGGPGQATEASFSELCAAYRERIAGLDELRVDVKTFSSERIDDEHFAIQAYVQTHGLRDGAPMQINHMWRVHWHGTVDDKYPHLTGVESLTYEEFEAPRPLFGDVSAAVFGTLPFWEDDFLLGAPELYRRKDRLAGNSYMGWQGIAFGDVDGDGLEDLYVCQPGGLANRLLLRKPDGSVEDIAGQANVDFLDNTRSALLLDLDNDGDQDLAVSMGPNVVVAYNDGTGRFPQATMAALPCGGTAFVHGLTAADVDRDGDLDLYACRYNTSGEAGALGGGLPVPYHDADNGGRNVLWRNDGVGRFTDATASLGLDENNTKFSLAAIFEDFDDDGDLDLYVTNDFGRNNYYRNDDGTFTDVADAAGLGELAASMGASVADYDRDGDFDIYLSNMFSSAGLRIVTQDDKFKPEHREATGAFISHARGNFMLANDGDGTFTDTSDDTDTEFGRWTWGARFVDFNNDGLEDLYVPNGFVTGPDEVDL